MNNQRSESFQHLAFISLTSPSLNDIPTSIHLTIPTGTGCAYCSAETVNYLSWPKTSAGSTQSLRCPNTTTIINRTCSPSGVWESVEPSLCTPFTSINPVSDGAEFFFFSISSKYDLQVYWFVYRFRVTSHLRKFSQIYEGQ